MSDLSLMRQLRRAVKARTWIIHLPIPLFGFLLWLWALISRQPAFTSSQLKALTAGDEFEVSNWPGILFSHPHTTCGGTAHYLRYSHFSQLEPPF